MVQLFRRSLLFGVLQVGALRSAERTLFGQDGELYIGLSGAISSIDPTFAA